MRSLSVLLVLGGLSLGTLSVLGCRTAPFVWVDDLPVKLEGPTEAYRLRSGDRVQVSVWRQPEMTTIAIVRDDGKISVPLVGDVRVLDLTPVEAAGALQIALKDQISATVTVIVVESRADRVAVIGEVENPGSYPIDKTDTVLDALAKAGGLTSYACRDCIYVIRAGQEKRVRFSYFKLAGVQGAGIRYRLHDGDIVVIE